MFYVLAVPLPGLKTQFAEEFLHYGKEVQLNFQAVFNHVLGTTIPRRQYEKAHVCSSAISMHVPT